MDFGNAGVTSERWNEQDRIIEDWQIFKMIAGFQKGEADYEQEDEVLVLPYTLFQVTNIQMHRQTQLYYIYLTNLPVPNRSVLSAWLQVSSLRFPAT